MEFSGKPTRQSKKSMSGKTLKKPKKLTVKRLKKRFKKNGLNAFEAYFNAFYIYSLKKRDGKGRKIKTEYKNVTSHPIHSNKSNDVIYKKNKYDLYLTLLMLFVAVNRLFWNLKSTLSRKIRRVRRNFSNTVRAFKFCRRLLIKAMSLLFPLSAVLLTVFLIRDFNSYELDFQVIINGDNYGIIQNVSDVENVASSIEKDLSSVHNYSYTLPIDIDYKIVPAKNVKYMTNNEIYHSIYNLTRGTVVYAYGLYVDGNLISTAIQKEELNDALDEIIKEYSGDEDETVEYLNEIEIIEQRYPKSYLMDTEEIKIVLDSAVNSNADEQGGDVMQSLSVQKIISEAEQTDTISRGTPESSLTNINRSAYSSHSSESDDIPNVLDVNAPPADASIILKKTKEVVYTEDIPFETVYKESSSYYKDTKIVQNEGANGKNEVTAKIVYVENEEIEREIIKEAVIVSPVDKVIIVGTAPKPTTNPTGTYKSPLTSYYTTSKFSNEHKALDMVAPQGTPIYAIDAGTVIFSGTDGSYGTYVVIKHSNGIESLYAHMSSSLVSYGEKVYQGQQIGKVGSTGYSTGPHLHLEIRKNGVRVNPAGYIK